MTIRTSAFCSALEVSDVRYDLTIYGLFLKDIPRRLGTNTVLDASVNALTDAFSLVHSPEKSVNALKSYGRALKALRVCLNDPKTAGPTNIICAIYLLVICQVSFIRWFHLGRE
jgi:hypothetical protein